MLDLRRDPRRHSAHNVLDAPAAASVPATRSPNERLEVPSVTIVICTWNRAPLLRQTLASLSRLRHLHDGPVDLLVVNNNCTDDTAAVLAAAPSELSLTAVFEPIPGKSHALNRALRTARGEYLLFTDDDVLVDEDWLGAFRSALGRHPEQHIFGGPVEPWFPVDPDASLTASYPALATGFCGMDNGRLERVLEPHEEVVGANLAFSRAVLDGVAFDTRLGVSPTSDCRGEETELIRKLVQDGESILWIPDMRVRHYVDPSRMTRSYLSRFYRGRGEQYAVRTSVGSVPTVGGVPRWMIREWFEVLLREWLCRLAGLSLPVSRSLRAGSGPSSGAPRLVSTLIWHRERRWLEGAISKYRQVAAQ